jgi:hypothetical protein
MGRSGSDSPAKTTGLGAFVGMRTALVVALMSAWGLGCGGGPEGPRRIPMSGRVTLDGRADAEGRVRFAPAQGVSGPVASTAVKGGAYRFTSADGPVAGAHQVVFELMPTDAGGGTPPDASQTGPKPPPGPKGGGASPFRTLIRDAVVTEDSTTLDFELKSPTGP